MIEQELNEQSEDSYRNQYVVALQQAISDAKESSSVEPFCPNVEKLQHEITLQNLRAHFHKRLKDAVKWTPQGKIEKVIRACVHEQFDALCLDSVFYRSGDIRAVVLLHLAARDAPWVITDLKTLPEEYRDRLIGEFGKLHPHLEHWITNCDRTKLEVIPPGLSRGAVTTPSSNAKADSRRKPGPKRQKVCKRPRSSSTESRSATHDIAPIHIHDEARLEQCSTEHIEQCPEPHQDNIAGGQIDIFWDKRFPSQSVLRSRSVKSTLEPCTDQTPADSQAPLSSLSSHESACLISDVLRAGRERMSMLM